MLRLIMKLGVLSVDIAHHYSIHRRVRYDQHHQSPETDLGAIDSSSNRN